LGRVKRKGLRLFGEEGEYLKYSGPEMERERSSFSQLCNRGPRRTKRREEEWESLPKQTITSPEGRRVERKRVRFFGGKGERELVQEFGRHGLPSCQGTRRKGIRWEWGTIVARSFLHGNQGNTKGKSVREASSNEWGPVKH